MKFKAMALCLIIIFCLSAFLNAEEVLVRLNQLDQRDQRWITSQNFDERIIYNKEYVDVLANDEILAYFNQQNLDFQVIKTRDQIRRSLENYRSYDQTFQELHDYAINFPEITNLFSLGPSTCKNYYDIGNDSYEDFQHEIWCLKVSDNPGVEEDEPNVFFASAIHAREPISLEVVMAFMEDFFDNYGSDPEINSFVENNQIWFIPLINPDGHKLVYDELHLSHRKSMRDNNENHLPDFSSVDGVDLNRNFGYVWGPNGTSSNSSSQIYNGPEAFSEVETQYLRDLIQQRKFWAGITYHSQGEWVLYPLGHIPGACSFDHEIMGDLAEEMAETIPRINQPGFYRPSQAVDFGYTCQGTMGDWAYSEERVFGYTLELADQFIPDDPEPICQDNLQAFRVMLNRFNNRLLTGHVTDPWGTPLVAEINVVEVDEQAGMSDVEPYRTGEMFGRYWRPLLSGTYNLIVSCDGYESESFQDIIISEDEITELDVILYPNWWGDHSKGDVDDNSIIDAFDASVLMRYLVGWDPAPYAPLPWEDWRIIISDINLDGELDTYDCSTILQCVVGVIDPVR